MFRAVRWILSSLVTLIVLYACFFVPIGGSRTLWEHTRRIIGTPEAQELGHDIHNAGAQVATKIRHEVVPVLLPGHDAGILSDGGAHRRTR